MNVRNLLNPISELTKLWFLRSGGSGSLNNRGRSLKIQALSTGYWKTTDGYRELYISSTHAP